MNRAFKLILITLASILVLAIVAVAAIYLWPLKSSHLQTGTPETISLEESIIRVGEVNKGEVERSVTDSCQSKTLLHEEKTERAVVFFHGITACPDQFDDLAQHFFDAGYNVYLPLAPNHGTSDVREHANMKASEMIDYVNQSVTITTGLGEEVGVVGLSGGSLLGTWAAQYRPEVERLLLLSPFYEPAASQAPKWQLPLLKVLHGKRIIPDAYSNGGDERNPGFSYRALAQYLIIGENFKKNPTDLSLKNIGVVTSEDDDAIDKDLAHSIPESIANANNLNLLTESIPAAWETGHAISSTDVPGVKQHQEELFSLYLDFYEGRSSSLEQPQLDGN